MTNRSDDFTRGTPFPRRVGRWSARAAAAFCLGFASFQAALAVGAPFGELVWGGSSRVLPESLRAASAGAAVYLALAAVVMLVRAGDIGRRLPQWPFWWINLLLALQLALNTLANLTAASPLERYGMGAASATGCGLCLGALWAGRKAAG